MERKKQRTTWKGRKKPTKRRRGRGKADIHKCVRRVKQYLGRLEGGYTGYPPVVSTAAEHRL